jgi:site-specific recombinase XerD
LHAVLHKDADSTQQGYAADFRLFVAWCEVNGLPSLPATIPSVATYIAIEAQRGIRPATIERRLAAIQLHPHRSWLRVTHR